MTTPIHIQDQRDAALRDALAHATIRSGAKLVVMMVVYPDYDSNAIAGVNIDTCQHTAEFDTGSLLGRVTGERLLMMYRQLEVEANRFIQSGQPLHPGGARAWLEETLNRVTLENTDPATIGEIAQAIIRNCLKYGCLQLGDGRWTEEVIMNRVKALAAVATSKEWREKQ